MRRVRGGWIAASALLVLAGCAPSASVVGKVGTDGLIYRGRAFAESNGQGAVEMASPDGQRCAGKFRYTDRWTGDGWISCEDGRHAIVKFTALGATSGYGTGTLNDGDPVIFTYGMSEEVSERQMAATPAPTPPSKGGTGFFVSGDGYILTNHRVLDGCTRIVAWPSDGTRRPASLVAADATLDLAVAKIATPAPGAAAFGESHLDRLGDPVAAITYQLVGYLPATGAATRGRISALAGPGDDSRRLQVVTPVVLGNSGGPLIDREGTVVGVVVARSDQLTIRAAEGGAAQNVVLAIKDGVAKDFLRRHGIPFVERRSGPPTTTAELGKAVSAYTVFLDCRAD